MEQSAKSSVDLNGGSQLKQHDSINNRFPQYVDRVRNLEVELCLKEAEDRLTKQHEIHAAAIQELREKYEIQMKLNRDEIEAVHATKIRAVQNDAEHNKAALSATIKELKISQDQFDDNNAKTVILEQINLSLHDRIAGLQSALENECFRSTKYNIEIERLRKEIAMHLDEHRELMNAKKSLARQILMSNFLSVLEIQTAQP
ncbi:hypothetical protein HA402_004803 [Bradysia odoriphaga]|nr:hypothetical protein HA402_004803 [Bradysia odoriphaga]